MKNAGLQIIQVNVSGVNGAKQQQQPRMHTLPAAVAPVGIGLI